MHIDKIFELYRELQAYVGWSEDDAEQVRSVADLLKPHLGPLIDDFYAEIQRHPQANKVITGGPAQVERLKGTLLVWVGDLLTATCDRDYVARRWKVGWRHVDIGLPQAYTNAAMSRLRTGLMQALYSSPDIDAEHLSLAARALNKMIDLDLAVIEDAYQTEFLIRQDRVKRLSTIGELAGGVAHELRNPLGIIRNSAYFLRISQKELSQDAKDAFDELERGLATSNRLVSELLDYVREPKRQESEFPVTAAIDEALSRIEIPAAVNILHPVGQDVVVCRADKGQIVQIIVNLICNAFDAMPKGGDLKLCAMHQENYVVLEVTDSGPGIAATDLEKIFEPLFSRKIKGIGLGLAVSRRYAELNHGSLEVRSVPGCGATFQLKLPAPEPREIEV